MVIKIRQHDREWTNLLTEIRFNWKEGTHKTLVNVIEGETWTVPIWVTETKTPLGNSTGALTTNVTVVKHEREYTIWSVAPVSIIHKFSLVALGNFTLEANTECERLGVKVFGKQINL